jgi:hypothetical protein
MSKFGLELIKKLKPIKFRYDSEKFHDTVDKRIHFGFSAQDLAAILSPEKYAAISRDPQGFFMIDYIELISPLVKGLQETLEEIDKLKEEIRLLKENNTKGSD